MALWSGVTGLGHLCFVIGAQSLVARQCAPHEQDRNSGHFTIGAALGRMAAGTFTARRRLCAGVALPVPVWALGLMLTVLGFCLGVGQPLSMTTVVQAAPEGARSTALALRLTGNRLGQAAAPATAGLVAGVAGVAAPFVMPGALLLLLLSSGVALRSPGRPKGRDVRRGSGPGARYCAARAISDDAPGADAAGRGAREAESWRKSDLYENRLNPEECACLP